jgi:hypothetical protein
VTLSESYERLQEDEVVRLWQLARVAPAGPLGSPFDGAPMKRFALPYDEDEVAEGGAGDEPDAGTVQLDVDVANQFVWFDADELDELPADRPDPEPSSEELARVAEIAAQFGAGIEDAARARDGGALTERLYRRIARSPEARSTLDRLGRALSTY